MSVTVRLLATGDGMAILSWAAEGGEPVDGEDLRRVLSAAAEDALAGGLRRIEIVVPATDWIARRAVLRSGFRVEGSRRSVAPADRGAFDDLVLFARLGTDVVGGPHGFSSVMNTVLPRKRVIAHVLIRDAEDRILLCDTRFKSDWELPGGVVEPGETPRAGAIREVREELGIELEVGQLLVIDWMPPYLGWDDAIEMIFDGGRVQQSELASFVLQDNEISSVALVSLDEATSLVTPLSHRRLSVAVCLPDDQTAYLEDGRRM